MKEIIENENDLEALASRRIGTIKKISHHTTQISLMTQEMIEERKKANVIENCIDRIEKYELNVKPYLDKIRYHIDKLELIVDDEIWPLPKYRELLFNR